MSSWLDAASLKTSWNTKDVEEQSKRWTSRRCCHCKFGVITVKCINLSEKNQGVALKRIEEEVTVLRNIRHCNVIQVYGFTSWRNNVGLIFEQGVWSTLRCLLVECKVPWNFKLLLLRDLASALAYLHHSNDAKPFVHGNVNANEVLLTVDLRLKLKYLGRLGTLGWSPGRCQHVVNGCENSTDSLTTFHDVYCFGLVVSEVICHETALDDIDAASLLEKNAIIKKQLKANGFQQDLHLVKLLEKLTENCVCRKCVSRPTMVDVRDLLQNEMKKRDMRQVIVEKTKVLSQLSSSKNDPQPRTVRPSTNLISLKNFSSQFIFADRFSAATLDDATAVSVPELEYETIVFLGGLHPGTSSEVIEYDPSIDKMDRLPPLQVARWNGSAVTCNSCIYMIGGVANGLASAAVECLFLQSRQETWQTKQPMLEARKGAFAVTTGGKIYVTGGFGDDKIDASSSIHSSIECYDPPNDEWEKVGDLLVPRGHHVSTAYKNVVYSVGGVIDGDPDHSDSMESFNLSSNQSTLMPSMSIRRVACSGATLNGSFYVCGGQKKMFSGLQKELFSNLDTAERFDIEAGEWVSDVPNMLKTTKSCGACVDGNKLYIIGGVGLNDVGKSIQVFDTKENKWDLLPRRLRRDWIYPAATSITRKRRLNVDRVHESFD